MEAAAGGAAPAATSTTAAPETNATPNGATGPQTPAKGPPPKSPVVPTQKGQPRAPNGQFAGGADGQPEPAPEKEPYRFKKRIKWDGREEEVDYSEDDVTREIQIARAARGRLSELRKAQEAQAKRQELAKSNPLAAFEEAAKELGIDPDELATRRLAERARRGMMTPEEQRIAQLETEKQALEQEREERRIADEATAARELEDKQWAEDEPLFMKAFEEFDLPKEKWVMGMMGSVGIEFQDALGKKAPLNPRDVVAETNRRLEAMGNRYVMNLPVEMLMKKLGKDRVEGIIRAHLQGFKKSQVFEPPVVTEAAPDLEAAPEPTGGQKEWMDPSEFLRRQRERWNK